MDCKIFFNMGQITRQIHLKQVYCFLLFNFSECLCHFSVFFEMTALYKNIFSIFSIIFSAFKQSQIVLKRMLEFHLPEGYNNAAKCSLYPVMCFQSIRRCISSWESALSVSYSRLTPSAPACRWHRGAVVVGDSAQIKAPAVSPAVGPDQANLPPTNTNPLRCQHFGRRYRVCHWPASNSAASLASATSRQQQQQQQSRGNCQKNDGWRGGAQLRVRIQRCLLAFLAAWMIAGEGVAMGADIVWQMCVVRDVWKCRSSWSLHGILSK